MTDLKKKMVTSGVRYMDMLLGGGVIIGDNVIWYDDAGSLASVFAMNLINASMVKKKSVIYVNFNHSPKSLLEKLGGLAKYPSLVILDCFTDGRGEGSDIFTQILQSKEKRRRPDHPGGSTRQSGSCDGRLLRASQDHARGCPLHLR